MDSHFQAEIALADGEVVLIVRGEIDIATAPDFERACRRVATLTDRLILDFTGVTFMDCSGLKVLLAAHERGHTSSITLRNASDLNRRVLEIAGATHILTEDTTAAGHSEPPNSRDTGSRAPSTTSVLPRRHTPRRDTVVGDESSRCSRGSQRERPPTGRTGDDTGAPSH